MQLEVVDAKTKHSLAKLENVSFCDDRNREFDCTVYRGFFRGIDLILGLTMH